MKTINFRQEWQFLEKCERNSHTAISAKQRFIELLDVFRNIPKPKNILDIGGNFATAKWFKAKFPNSKVTILNKSEKELSSYPQFIKADAQFFRTKEKYDLVFSGETIEHTYNPDGLIACCLLALKPNGYFIITTPNLSCLYNRIFLLFGWTPGNYSPSIRFLTGNPFLSNKEVTKFGNIGDHKSVFTWKGLYELLKKYGFKIINYRGYSYGQEKKIKALGNLYYKVPKGKLRLLLNRFLPTKIREGMIFVCQAPNKIDRKQALQGVLKKDLWQF